MNSFQSHNRICYIALNYDKNTLIGALATIPINIYFNGNKQEIYYADFLCVHPKYRKKGVAQRVLYTLTYKSQTKRFFLLIGIQVFYLITNLNQC